MVTDPFVESPSDIHGLNDSLLGRNNNRLDYILNDNSGMGGFYNIPPLDIPRDIPLDTPSRDIPRDIPLDTSREP